jgi:hypothetical protein
VLVRPLVQGTASSVGMGTISSVLGQLLVLVPRPSGLVLRNASALAPVPEEVRLSSGTASSVGMGTNFVVSKAQREPPPKFASRVWPPASALALAVERPRALASASVWGTTSFDSDQRSRPFPKPSGLVLRTSSEVVAAVLATLVLRRSLFVGVVSETRSFGSSVRSGRHPKPFSKVGEKVFVVPTDKL